MNKNFYQKLELKQLKHKDAIEEVYTHGNGRA